MDFKRVTSSEDAKADAIIVTLYLCEQKRVRAWYVGPTSQARSGIRVPYVPHSARMVGMVALLRAHAIAVEMKLPVYVVDPENVWKRVIEPQFQ